MIGTVLAVAAQLILGWPWWLVAVALVVALALFFLSTAFWGGRSREPVMTHYL